MTGFLLRALIAALGLWIAAEVVPGVAYDDLISLALAALLLGVINAIVRPIAILLSLPLLILTLGLFLFVINALLLELVTVFVRGLHLRSFGSALLASLVVSITSWIGSSFIGSKGRIRRARRR